MAISKDSYNDSRFRVGGSGFTAFQWDGKIIGFANSIRHTSPKPVANPVPIQPMDQRYPLQIITPAALGPGTLEVQMFERYNEKIWDRMLDVTATNENISGYSFGAYNDLVQIFITLAAINRPISCVKVINAPVLNRGGVSDQTKGYYGDVYHGCVITDIRDDEEVEIGTMEIVKSMTITYTRYTRVGSSTNINFSSPFLAPTTTFAL